LRCLSLHCHSVQRGVQHSDPHVSIAHEDAPAQAAENAGLHAEIAGLAARLAALEQQVNQNPH